VHLYVKVPNTDKLRSTAAGRHRYLLATGWREVERKQDIDHVTVRYERTGHVPWKERLPKGGSEPPRMERRPRGQFGGARGGFGGGRGGRGGPRGGPGGGPRGGPGGPSRGGTGGAQPDGARTPPGQSPPGPGQAST
jgi:hypothetical protein